VGTLGGERQANVRDAGKETTMGLFFRLVRMTSKSANPTVTV